MEYFFCVEWFSVWKVRDQKIVCTLERSMNDCRIYTMAPWNLYTMYNRWLSRPIYQHVFSCHKVYFRSFIIMFIGISFLLFIICTPKFHSLYSFCFWLKRRLYQLHIHGQNTNYTEAINIFFWYRIIIIMSHRKECL